MDLCIVFFFFFFKQKTAYEMRISDWSSDVCSSDLTVLAEGTRSGLHRLAAYRRHSPRQQVCRWRTPCWPVLEGKSLRRRSEEHTSELQSLMRTSYAAFCLKKKKMTTTGSTTLHNEQIEGRPR